MFELGSGRGQLAFYMASQAPEMKYVLVDYSGVKHKADNRLKTVSFSFQCLLKFQGFTTLSGRIFDRYSENPLPH